MTLKELLVGFGTPGTQYLDDRPACVRQTRNADVSGRAGLFTARYRGRIVLTRDPDGEERCVACNLCAVACPVGCISLQKAETKDGRWYPEFSALTSHAASSAACAKKRARPRRFS